MKKYKIKYKTFQILSGFLSNYQNGKKWGKYLIF